MNLSTCMKIAYENKSNWTLGENKPNQTQFQTQSSLAQTLRFATLERHVVMAYQSRYWRTKPNMSDELFRKVVQKC